MARWHRSSLGAGLIPAALMQKQTMGWVKAGCESSALQVPNAPRMLSAHTSHRLCRTAQTLSKTGAEIGVKGLKVLLQLPQPFLPWLGTAAGPVDECCPIAQSWPSINPQQLALVLQQP